MSEFWVSKSKFWCKFCKVFVYDNPNQRKKHDSTDAHKHNVKKSLENTLKQQQISKKETELAKRIVSGVGTGGINYSVSDVSQLKSVYYPSKSKNDDKFIPHSVSGTFIASDSIGYAGVAGDWTECPEIPIENSIDLVEESSIEKKTILESDDVQLENTKTFVFKEKIATLNDDDDEQVNTGMTFKKRKIGNKNIRKKMLSRVSKVVSSMLKFNGFDSKIISNLSIIECTKDSVICEMVVEQNHLNRLSTLHGGVVCSLVDIAGSLAVACKTQSEYTGVSTDLSVSFLSSSKIGDKLRITSICHKSGRTLAFTNITIESECGKIIATGSHTKFVGGL